MKLRLFAYSLLCFALVPTNAFAAIERLFPGVVNEIEDQDYETIASGDGDFIVEVDELIGGVIKFQLVRNTTDSATRDLQTWPDTFTALFLIKVASSNGEGILDGDIDTINFKPASQTEWDSVFGDGGSLDLPGVSASPITVATGTMIQVFEGVSFSTANEAAAPLGTSAGSFIGGGTLLWEFGFTGGGDTPAAGEFWFTRGEDADVASAVLTTDPSNRISLNLTNNPSGYLLDPHNHLGTGDTFFTTPVQLQGKGGFQDPSGQSWPIATDTNVYIKPLVPEPASVIAWFALATLGGAYSVVRVRRRA